MDARARGLVDAGVADDLGAHDLGEGGTTTEDRAGGDGDDGVAHVAGAVGGRDDVDEVEASEGGGGRVAGDARQAVDGGGGGEGHRGGEEPGGDAAQLEDAHRPDPDREKGDG